MTRPQKYSRSRKDRLTRLREEKLTLELAQLRPKPRRKTPLIAPIEPYNFDCHKSLKAIKKHKKKIQVRFTELQELETIKQQEDALTAYGEWLLEEMGEDAVNIEMDE